MEIVGYVHSITENSTAKLFANTT